MADGGHHEPTFLPDQPGQEPDGQGMLPRRRLDHAADGLAGRLTAHPGLDQRNRHGRRGLSQRHNLQRGLSRPGRSGRNRLPRDGIPGLGRQRGSVRPGRAPHGYFVVYRAGFGGMTGCRQLRTKDRGTIAGKRNHKRHDRCTHTGPPQSCGCPAPAAKPAFSSPGY